MDGIMLCEFNAYGGSEALFYGGLFEFVRKLFLVSADLLNVNLNIDKIA